MSDLKMVGHLDIKGHDAIKRVYSPEGIAPTLTTSGGGYREVKILDMSRFRVRKLTPTEYGRLQAFPMEDWEQVVSDSQAYKQFGNAVTTTVVTGIAEQIKAALDVGKNRPADEPAETIADPLEAFSTEELLRELMRRNAIAG
jgi:site-specific DNA-cytosine methylase